MPSWLPDATRTKLCTCPRETHFIVSNCEHGAHPCLFKLWTVELHREKHVLQLYTSELLSPCTIAPMSHRFAVAGKTQADVYYEGIQVKAPLWFPPSSTHFTPFHHGIKLWTITPAKQPAVFYREVAGWLPVARASLTLQTGRLVRGCSK
jgi:hypothetical protein